MQNWLNKILLRITGEKLSSFDQAQIVKGTLQSVVIQVVSILLVFVSNLVWVRITGADQYGIFVHVFNWVAILSVVALMGNEDLLLAEVPRYEAEHEQPKTDALIRHANKGVLIRSIIILVAFLTIIFIFNIPSLSNYKYHFILGGLSIIFSSLITLNQTALQALHKVKLSQLVEKIIKPLLLIIAAFIAGKLILKPNAETLVAVNSIVLLVSFISILIIGLRYLKFQTSYQPTFIHTDLRKKTIYFFFISLLYMLGTRLHMLILSYYYPGKEIGIFNICYRFADLLILPSYLMHYILPQLFSRNYSTGQKYNQSLFNVSTRIMLSMSIPLMILIALAGKLLLGWFGDEFKTGYTCLLLLTAAQFIFSMAILYNTVLMTQDNEKQAAFCLLIFCLSLIISNILLIPSKGISGAGWAGLISSVIYYIVVAANGYRLKKILPHFLTRLK